MSLDPMLWALKDAPTANVEEFAVLSIMAEAAHEDGCNSFLSQQTIARRTKLSDRTVRDRLAELESRRLIARGNQAAAAHIPADRRPVVYDLLIPFSWFPRIQRVNEYRATHGRPPLTPEMRPDIADPPPRKRRADLGRSKRPAKSGESGTEPGTDGTGGVQLRPDETDVTTGVQLRPELKSGTAGVQLHDGRSTTPPTNAVNPPNNPPPLPPAAEQATAAVPGAEPGEGIPDRSDEATQDALTVAVAAARRLRPGWTTRSIVRAMDRAIAAERTPELVAWAIVKAAEDHTTDVPGRITSDAWWTSVLPTRHVTAPGQHDLGPRCQLPGHLAEVAERCSICANDRRIAAAEAARVVKIAGPAPAEAAVAAGAADGADGVSAAERARRVALEAPQRFFRRAGV